VTLDEDSEIPPTEVGGWFRSNLHPKTETKSKSHLRQLVDCSDPASETQGRMAFQKENRTGWI
jgi:hypothetical protein